MFNSYKHDTASQECSPFPPFVQWIKIIKEEWVQVEGDK